MTGELRRVRVAYGRTGIAVDLPASRTVVIDPAATPAAADARAEVRNALRNPVSGAPLRDLVRRGQRVAISVCDGTRPQPRELMVTEILHELADLVDRADVTILIATGTHRGNTEAELLTMLGPDIVGSIRIVNHDARDADSLVWCGTFGDGVPVWLAREWVEADVRITTGFVEPHFFAGFSGGPKLVAPGLAGLDTVLTLHDAARIGSADATWAVCEGNPVHDDVRAIAAGTGVTFACDVILDREQQVIRAFGGEILAMHAAARHAAREIAMQPVDGLFDVVVTSNAGFPLDQSLYQSVKGMSAAALVVKDGGLIICAAECSDGFPDHGSFREVLSSAPSAQALLELIAGRRVTVADQWQVQVLARILVKARVQMFTAGLTRPELATAHIGYTDDIAATVADELHRAGPESRVCVLPEGPMTIPYLDRAPVGVSS